MAFIDTAKQWFLRWKKPTQAQFAQTFEWLRWKDELIGIADLAQEIKDLLNQIGTGGGGSATVNIAKVVYNANAGQMVFATPRTITNINNLLVFAMGVNVSFTNNGGTDTGHIKLLDAREAGDEIIIIQF